MTEHEVDKLREQMLKVAYSKYSMPEFKSWAIDKIVELAQQVSRINTKHYDQELLIRTGLMVEDAVAMIWLLLESNKTQIHKAKQDIYQEFETMVREEHCKASGDCKHNLDSYKK